VEPPLSAIGTRRLHLLSTLPDSYLQFQLCVYMLSDADVRHRHVMVLKISFFFAAFLAVAGEDFGRQIPFAFLERIKAEWREKLADKSRTATAHSLDKTFGYAC
jgi:hypothetical protein